MTVTYTHSQCGAEQVGIWFTLADVNASTINHVGLQYTIPAEPDQLQFRSLTLNYGAVTVGGTGTLTISLVDDPDAQVFSNTNLPSTLSTIQVGQFTETFTVGMAGSFSLNLGTESPLSDTYVGDIASAGQVFGHSNFQGNIAIVITSDVTVRFPPPTLVGDEEPFLTGLPSGRQRQSRADFCPRCGGPVFREQLVRDGYTKALVCASCYDPPERRRKPWKPRKEVNP